MNKSNEKQLWKRPVEKPVENVEKFGFSTEKPDFTNKRTANGLDKFLHKKSHNPNGFALCHRK